MFINIMCFECRIKKFFQEKKIFFHNTFSNSFIFRKSLKTKTCSPPVIHNYQLYSETQKCPQLMQKRKIKRMVGSVVENSAVLVEDSPKTTNKIIATIVRKKVWSSKTGWKRKRPKVPVVASYAQYRAVNGPQKATERITARNVALRSLLRANERHTSSLEKEKIEVRNPHSIQKRKRKRIIRPKLCRPVPCPFRSPR